MKSLVVDVSHHPETRATLDAVERFSEAGRALIRGRASLQEVRSALDALPSAERARWAPLVRQAVFAKLLTAAHSAGRRPLSSAGPPALKAEVAARIAARDEGRRLARRSRRDLRRRLAIATRSVPMPSRPPAA